MSRSQSSRCPSVSLTPVLNAFVATHALRAAHRMAQFAALLQPAVGHASIEAEIGTAVACGRG
jgi:hypothetical protein